MTTLVFDIEGSGLLDTIHTVHCIVTKDRASHVVRAYHNEPTFTPHDGSLEDGYTALEEASQLWGHNILSFDVPAVQKIGGCLTGLSLIDVGSKVRDTLLMSQVAWPDIDFRKDLPWAHRMTLGKGDKLVPIRGYGLAAFGQRMGNYKGDPGGGWEVFTQQMLTYCIQDVEVNFELAECLESHAYYKGMEPYGASVWESEHMFAWLMFIQQAHGWPFDVAAASSLQAVLQEHKDELHDKLAHLVAPVEKVGKTPMFYCHPEYPGDKWPTKGALEKWLSCHKTERTLVERKSEIHAGSPKCTLVYWKPSSREQVKKLLYDQYDWKPRKWGDGKANVKDFVAPTEYEGLLEKGWHEVIDDDVLEGLGIPALEPLADYFRTSKMLSMLATGAKAHMGALGPDGRIHGRVNSAKVLGGRCGHSGPNVAQVPSCNAKRPLNSAFRALYGCLPGHKLVGFDAGALEYRIMAHWGWLFDDGALAAIVDDPDKDLHWEFTKLQGLVQCTMDTARDEANHEWESARGQSKALNYAIPYGAQLAKIARMLGKSKEEAQELLDYMAISMPGMLGLRDDIVAKVEARGVTTKETKWKKEYTKYTPHTGWVKGIDGRINVIRSAHASLNTKLQGDGGLYMKRLLIELMFLCQEEGIRVFGLACPWWETSRAAYDVALLGNIHDEAQSSVAEAYVEPFMALVQKAFAKANQFYKMRCPVRGDSKVGLTWRDTH